MLGNAWANGERMICWRISMLMRTSRSKGEVFFHYGNLGTFLGDLTTLSTRFVIETFVLPVLLLVVEMDIE